MANTAYTSSTGSLQAKRITVAFAALACVLASSPVFAQSATAGVLCSIIGIIYSNFAMGICVMAVIMLGVGAMVGKVSWPLALTVAVGITIIYGASTFAAAFFTHGAITSFGTTSTTVYGCI